MTKRVLYGAAAILLVVVAYLSYNYISYKRYRHQEVAAKGQATTLALRDALDALLLEVEQEAATLAEQINTREFTAAELEQLLRESALRIPALQGVTACFEPYAFADDQRLYCPYYNKGDKQISEIGSLYDYTDPERDAQWYLGVRDNGATWVEPYYGQGVKAWYVDYGTPFYHTSGPKRGEVRGTITMSFLASGFKELVHEISVGKANMGIVVNERGTFLAHPDADYVGLVNLDSIIPLEEELRLRRAYLDMEAGRTGEVRYYDPARADYARFVYERIPATNWGVGLLFYENDLLADQQSLNRRLIRLALFASLLLLVCIATYFAKDHLDDEEVWQLSFLGGLLLVANILLIGYLQHSTPKSHGADKSPPIIDNGMLASFVEAQTRRAERLKHPDYRKVPTGLYIQRMEFEDSYNLNVSGTLWQKYPGALADSVETGFQFPQLSPFAEAGYVEETYNEYVAAKEGAQDYRLIGWEFRVTLRLNLAYADFPFDKRHINVEIAPRRIQDRLLFTPDLSSYSSTNPTRKSGLDPKLRLAGSEIQESYFNYSLETYATDFGYGRKALFEDVPVLHYHVYVQRKLLNAFVTYLIPIAVTLIMVFILVYAIGKTEERQGIIESMAAFFFVLIFSHIDLRKEIETAELIYIEYFYFIAYFMLILATANLITYSKNKSRIFDYQDNLIFKAIFFPIFFFLALVVTLVKFY